MRTGLSSGMNGRTRCSVRLGEAYEAGLPVAGCDVGRHLLGADWWRRAMAGCSKLNDEVAVAVAAGPRWCLLSLITDRSQNGDSPWRPHVTYWVRARVGRGGGYLALGGDQDKTGTC